MPKREPRADGGLSIRAKREARELPLRVADLEAEVAELRAMVRFLYQQMMDVRRSA